MISVSDVKLTDDLRFAKIYLSFYATDNTKSENYLKLIKDNKNIIKYKLGVQLKTKYVPNIEFFLSDEYERYDRIDNLSKI